VNERPGANRLVAWATIVGVLAALGYAGRFAGGKQPKEPLYHWDNFVGGLVQFLVLLGFMLLVARGLPKKEAFALRRPRSWGRAAAIAFGTVVVILVVSAALDPVLNPNKEQGLTPNGWAVTHLQSMIGGSTEPLVFAIVAAIAVAAWLGAIWRVRRLFGRPQLRPPCPSTTNTNVLARR